MTADDLEAMRLSLPVDDPDRHDLDTVADERFAHLAPGYPDTSSPVDFAASDAAGYVTRAYTDCEPEFAPRPVRSVETGGRL
jgi:hypothetical protein